MFVSKASAFAVLLVDTLLLLNGAEGKLCVALGCPKRKRDLGLAEREPITAAPIERRSVVGSDPSATVWELDASNLPPWAALPYESCGAAGPEGTTICPTGYHCRCQVGTTMRCMPNSPAPSPTPTGCSVYTGPSSYTQCDFWWSTTRSTMQTAYGQCGGFISSNINSGWNVKTHCPQDYDCACQQFWYSQCLPTATATNCPPASEYWGCGAAHVYTSPTQIGDVCGGHCYTAKGYTHKCPGTLKCYTNIGAPYPGNIAGCYGSAPATWEATYQATPIPLCYPVPFTWGDDNPIPVPTCSATSTSTTGGSNTAGGVEGGIPAWGQCGGYYTNSNGVYTTWGPPKPTACTCGHYCSGNGLWAGCWPIDGADGQCGFTPPTQSTPSPGPSSSSSSSPSPSPSGGCTRTQTLYGQCGGGDWTCPTNCGPNAHCDGNSWWKQCNPGPAPGKKRNAEPASFRVERQRRTPVENPSSQVTPAYLYNGKYEQATVGSKPKF